MPWFGILDNASMPARVAWTRADACPRPAAAHEAR